MKQTLSTWQVADAIHGIYNGDNFSRSGSYALAEYLEEYEESTGEELELDPISIACDFTEWDTLEDCIREMVTEDEYGLFKDEDGFCDELIRDYLQDNTTLIEFDGGIIIASF